MDILLSDLFLPGTFSGEVWRFVIVLGIFGFIFVGAEIWHIVADPPVEWTRKLVHFGCGLVISCFHWIFSTVWPVIGLGVGIALVMAGGRYFHKFASIYGIQRKSWGDVYYLISVIVLFMISYDRPVFYFISLLTLTIADSFAAILGSAYHKTSYSVETQSKSFEGSAVFFLFTFLIVEIPLLLFTDLDRQHCILMSFQIALITACLEAVCVNGLDNLFVPFGTYYLLYQYEDLNAEVILELLAWQAIFLMFSSFVAWRLQFFTVSSAIIVQLFLLCVFFLGEPIWLVTPLIAFAVLLMAFAFFSRKGQEKPEKNYQVTAVFYLILVPTIIVIGEDFIRFEVPAISESLPYLYSLFIGCVCAQLVIALFHVIRSYALGDRLGWPGILLIALGTMVTILPFGLWIRTERFNMEDYIVACMVTVFGSLAYYFIFRAWHLSLPFPWEFRIQSLGVASGVVMAILVHFFFS